MAAKIERQHQRTATPILSQSTDMSHLTQADLDKAAHSLNGRPRQTLDGMSPSSHLEPAAHSGTYGLANSLGRGTQLPFCATPGFIEASYESP